jgi:hypothetical protein
VRTYANLEQGLRHETAASTADGGNDILGEEPFGFASEFRRKDPHRLILESRNDRTIWHCAFDQPWRGSTSTGARSSRFVNQAFRDDEIVRNICKDLWVQRTVLLAFRFVEAVLRPNVVDFCLLTINPSLQGLHPVLHLR